MLGNKRRDTLPELRLRSHLHAAGLRFRVDYKIEVGPRPVRADIAFPRIRLAVFVDGCFWHGCPLHPRPSKSHLDYWSPKIERTRVRDAAQTAALQQAGWLVIRGWEHEVAHELAARVESTVITRRRDDAGAAD